MINIYRCTKQLFLQATKIELHQKALLAANYLEMEQI